MAFHFHWSKREVLEMNGHERKIWIDQLNEIIRSQREVRMQEVMVQTQSIMALQQSQRE